MNRFVYLITGAVVAAILIVPTVLFINRPLAPTDFSAPIAEAGVTRLAANAFGTLVNQAQQPTAEGFAAAVPLADGATAESGSAVSAIAPTAKAIGLGGGGVAQSADSLIYPAPVQYSYVYKGEPITIENSSLPVYRRVKSTGLGASLARLAGNVGLGLLDVNSFGNVSVQNIALVQDRDFGYIVNVDFNEGMLSIYQNWQRWQTSVAQPYQPLTLDQIPSNDTLITMANDFVAAHKINTSGYGSPIVREDWRANPDGYVPDVVNVVYPLQVEGNSIYDLGGTPMGIEVAIDVRNNRVSNAYNIGINKFESSDYEVETDTSRLVRIAEQGGQFWPIYYYEGLTTAELTLGTPTLVYVQTWQYNEKTQENFQLYAPALKFPVIDKPANAGYAPQNIVVPIVKELIQEPTNPEPRPLPAPLPVIQAPAATEPATSDSAPVPTPTE